VSVHGVSLRLVATTAAGLLTIVGVSRRAQGQRGPVTDTMPAAGAGVGRKGDSITVRLLDVDVRAAVQTLAPYLDRPVVFGVMNAGRVTFQTPQPVPQSDVPRLLRGLVESQGLELVVDSAARMYRVRTKEAPHAAIDASLHTGTPNGSTGPVQLYVLRLRHARAADVAATVNALYGRASALGESSAQGTRGAGPTLGQELQQNVLPPQYSQQSVSAAPQAVPGLGSRTAALSGETAIIPDPGTNALFIRATRSDLDLIQAAVKELDIRPLQVLIEVLIAEVRRDRSFTLGVGTLAPNTIITGNPRFDGVSIGGITGNGPAGDNTLGDFVLRVMHVGGGVNFSSTLIAAEARGEARILSRPVLIAANNESAEILVGSQRPFVQAQRSLATSIATRDQLVQYKDVGTKLTVRPTISSDGYVALAVTQEVNQATTEVQFDAPVISTRTVQTKLIVRDSQTVILGGLADQQRDATRTGSPYLSRIPVIGGLFGNTSRQTAETEFFLFITPRIIRSDDDAAAVTEPIKTSMDRVKP
jgi:general secretion pathway protein D